MTEQATLPPGAAGAASHPDHWQIERLDLAAYMRRIDYRGPTTPDDATLRSLHQAHLAAIAFENLDIVLGRSIEVGLQQVQEKLVTRGRGGYCYEHGVLFGAVLQRLGYQVDRLLARTGDPAEHPRPRSHMVLRVGAGDRAWLADVGFGSGLLEPLALAESGPQRQGAWEYALVHGQDGAWRLREGQAGGWTTIMTFTEEPQYPVDIEVANYNTATNPHSPFVQQCIVVRKDATSVRRLLGREYTVERPGAGAQHEMLTDAAFTAALSREFGLFLSPAEEQVLIAALPPEADDGAVPLESATLEGATDA